MRSCDIQGKSLFGSFVLKDRPEYTTKLSMSTKSSLSSEAGWCVHRLCDEHMLGQLTIGIVQRPCAQHHAPQLMFIVNHLPSSICKHGSILSHFKRSDIGCACAGGPQMQRVWFFDFEARQWSSRLTSGGRTDWTFGHAIRRSRYMYAYGTHHTTHTEESVAAVSPSRLKTRLSEFRPSNAVQVKDLSCCMVHQICVCMLYLQHYMHTAESCYANYLSLCVPSHCLV